MKDHSFADVNVRVWRHDLRCRPGGVELLPPDWMRLLQRRGLQVGYTRLWDEGHNLVTASGLNLLRDWARGLANPLSHLAVGTDSTAVVSGDTELGTEVFRDIYTQVSLGTASMVIRYYLGPNDANGSTLTEAGLLNAGSGGTLYARRILGSPIVKTIDVAATLEWTLSWAAV